MLNEIYALLRVQINFFSPQQKLAYKQRIGAKVIKKYSTTRMPYQRVGVQNTRSWISLRPGDDGGARSLAWKRIAQWSVEDLPSPNRTCNSASARQALSGARSGS